MRLWWPSAQVCHLCGDRCEDNVVSRPRMIHYLTYLEEDGEVVVCAPCSGRYERGQTGGKNWSDAYVDIAEETALTLQ